jgi:hypothetical protein
VLAPVAPRVLAPWGLTQKCKHETLNIICNAWCAKCNMLHKHECSTYFDSLKLFTTLSLSLLIYLLHIKSLEINNMHDLSLNRLYDFIQVVYSMRRHYTKVEYFSKYSLFTAIYLLLD